MSKQQDAEDAVFEAITLAAKNVGRLNVTMAAKAARDLGIAYRAAAGGAQPVIYEDDGTATP